MFANSSAGGDNLRKSCHFCRRRKIKCSGQSKGICTACKERGIDCIYDLESAKGRPRGSSSNKHASKGSISGRSSHSEERGSAPPRSSEDSSEGHRLPPEFYRRETGNFVTSGTIGEALEFLYLGAFTDVPGIERNAFQASLNNFVRKLEPSPEGFIHSLGFRTDHPPAAISYDDLFAFMSQELVGLLSSRFGHLGTCLNEDPRAGFYVNGVARDRSQRMFGNNITFDTNPITEIDDQVRMQLIEVWFSVHPLSMLLSKTLFLQTCKNNEYDEALLAVILADAQHFHNAGQYTDLEGRLFKHADNCVRSRSVDTCDIPTSQALMLLGWHEMCTRNTKRASCLIGYSGQISSKIQAQMSDGTRVAGSRVNGIDVDAVETELVRNLHWLSFSTTLWAYMEMGEPFATVLQRGLPPDFPSVDETQSAVIKLDIASDIVSTFQAQARMIRGLWPLAQIVSTSAHIYALYPHESEAPSQGNTSWQHRPVNQLRRLLNFNEDFNALCQKIKKVLMDAIQTLNTEIRNWTSKAFVTIAYYVLIIHLNFPNHIDAADTSVPTTYLIRDFLASSTDLLRILAQVTGSQKPSCRLTSSHTATSTLNIVDIIPLGLDVCGRGLIHLHDRALAGPKSDHEAVSSAATQLQGLATELHSVAKDDLILTTTRVRPAKRTLKTAKNQFAAFTSLSDMRKPNTHPLTGVEMVDSVNTSPTPDFIAENPANPHTTATTNPSIPNITYSSIDPSFAHSSPGSGSLTHAVPVPTTDLDPMSMDMDMSMGTWASPESLFITSFPPNPYANGEGWNHNHHHHAATHLDAPMPFSSDHANGRKPSHTSGGGPLPPPLSPTSFNEMFFSGVGAVEHTPVMPMNTRFW
ncbi:hypothetical protein EJ05DRAFT_472152 [Pseudovirgaria hyperparasitica]|uniref:Zn(2)-C6 fungal-type domain-containing protein n=1 Tax=Pseudovirgaria hyperparasitica TaxID=470096 RepID=A0A6A6WM63_9PEZI|nr:uncharacterized protein EJ05DRAFT_472152 [Pseudovirgaria hyperparasitica]KAF2763238.1 hypothetical protein EJ05DRAFT_472152 [Pseudovirgaria hyperparasitica]